ncbi:MAG: gliding motility-associated C-terminal domain-containing protein [Saprospiraceae bacterium]|nr:gliding motility-associated C-terminal domain-containing protein [Saprospiraceae bacterium]
MRAALDGCYFTDTFQIEHTPAPAFGFADDTLMLCHSALPLTLETTDCCAEVLWSTGDTTKSTKIEQEGLVWVSQQNLCGILSDSFWLQVDYPLSIDLGADTALCDTTQFARLLQGPHGQPNYLWSTGETASAVTVTQPGTYWLEVRNECGVFTDTIVFKDLRQVRLAASRDTTLCLTEPVPLFATPGFDTYLWNTGDTGVQVVASDYGRYTVSATNDCGTQTDTVFVTESNYPAIQLPTEVEISLGDSIQLNPFVVHDKPLVFQWSPTTGLDCSSCESPLAFPWKTTDFLLIAEDGLRCREEAVVRVSVVDRRRIYIPNVFKPTGDGPNALLTLSFGGEVEEVVLAAIYDRWGGLVVSRQGLAASAETVIWDGKWRGKDAQPGVYALVLTVRLKNGEIVRVAKDETLVR